MNENFSTLSNIIKQRRSIKPSVMTGEKIPDYLIEELLQLADWAPTHTFSEPWRFVVYANESVNEFSKQHADLYQQNTSEEKFMRSKYDGIINNGLKASHIIACIMKRSNTKIPSLEETAAASCAIQNILLGATALNIATLWSTGGMVLQPAMKTFFNLAEEDEIMGLLFLGYSNEVIAGQRKIALAEKITWHK